MKSKVFFGAALLLICSISNAAVIDFDDYATGGTSFVTLVNDGQTAGLGQGMQVSSLSGWNIVIADGYNADWAAGVSSGSNTMGISWSVVFERIDGGLFDFNSAFLTSIYSDQSVVLQGLLGGSVVDSLSLDLAYGLGQVAGANFLDIDQLVLSKPDSGSWLGLDDFTFDATNVPEPGLILLFMTGLLGFGVTRRRASQS